MFTGNDKIALEKPGGNGIVRENIDKTGTKCNKEKCSIAKI